MITPSEGQRSKSGTWPTFLVVSWLTPAMGGGCCEEKEAEGSTEHVSRLSRLQKDGKKRCVTNTSCPSLRPFRLPGTGTSVNSPSLVGCVYKYDLMLTFLASVEGRGELAQPAVMPT